ncbi:hypothetical protein BaRGS_00031796, partial [Batillaria attramentaria]
CSFADTLSGTLHNNGHDITLYVDHSGRHTHGVNLTRGPLSYNYRVDRIKFHFGRDDNEGSEHKVQGTHFPVEIQILGYNKDLYANYSVHEAAHREFNVLHRAMNLTTYKGDKTHIRRLRIKRLLPSTSQYVTYEGSTTVPGCHETVTWIIYNRPIYISKAQLAGLRFLRQNTRYNPVGLMAGNIRPVQPLNQRTIRTNINFRERKCSMAQSMYYRGQYSQQSSRSLIRLINLSRGESLPALGLSCCSGAFVERVLPDHEIYKGASMVVSPRGPVWVYSKRDVERACQDLAMEHLFSITSEPGTQIQMNSIWKFHCATRIVNFIDIAFLEQVNEKRVLLHVVQ